MADLPSFEKVEYEGSSGSAAEQCVRCRLTLVDRFYLLNGQPLCELCTDAAVIAPPEGGDAAFLKAMINGFGAAVVGCILYAAVQIETGWTIGYMALAVGWLVGKAMKRGAGGRGGRRYQMIAVVLTYCSVSCASLITLLYAVRGREVVIGERFVMRAAEYILLSPVVLLQTGIRGIIGLVILFLGLSVAWALAAGSEYRISGPHPVTGTEMPL